MQKESIFKLYCLKNFFLSNCASSPVKESKISKANKILASWLIVEKLAAGIFLGVWHKIMT